MSPTRVTRVELQADVSSLVRGFRTSATEAKSLNRDVSSLERELERLSKVNAKPNITLLNYDAERRIDEIKRRLTDLGHQTADAKVNVNDAGAQTKLARIEAQLLAIGNQRAEPNIDIGGIAAAEAKLGIIQAELNHIDGQTVEANVKISGTATATKSMGLLASSIIALGPAAIAAGGVAGGAILGLGAAATTALVPLGALGATIAGQLASMKSQQQVIDATAKHLATLTKGTSDYKTTLQLLHAQQAAFNQQFGQAATAVGDLKLAWKSYLTEVGQGGVNQVIADAANLAAQILPKIEGMVTAAAGSVDTLLKSLSDFGKGPEAAAMLAFFQREGPAAIQAFGSILGNTGKGLVSLLMAFTPLAHGMAGGLQEVTAQFAAWAKNLPNTQGFADFMAYVERVGPKVWDTLGALAQAFIAIGTAAAPVGEVTLPLIKALADALTLIAKSPAGPALVGLAVALTTLNRAMVAMEAIQGSKLIANLSGIGTGVQTAGKRALAAKAGFLAAGIGLEVFASRLDSTHQDLKDFMTVAGGAAIGAAFGPWGAAIGGAAGLLQVLSAHSQAAADAQHALAAQAQSVVDKLNQETGAVTAAATAQERKNLADGGAFDLAAKIGLSFDTVTKAALNDSKAQTTLKASYDATQTALLAVEKAAFNNYTTTGKGAAAVVDAKNAVRDNATAWAALQQILGVTNTTIDAGTKSIQQNRVATDEAYMSTHKFIPSQANLNREMALLGPEMGVATANTKGHTAAQNLDNISVKEAARDAQDLYDKLHNLDVQALARFDSATAQAAALKALAAGIKSGGTSLDPNSAAGQTNRANISQFVQTQLAAADAMNGQLKRNASLKASNQQLYETLRNQFHLTEAAAHKLADSLIRVPKTVYTTVQLDAMKANQDMKALIAKYHLTPKQVHTVITNSGAETAAEKLKAVEGLLHRIMVRKENRVVVGADIHLAADEFKHLGNFIDHYDPKDVVIVADTDRADADLSKFSKDTARELTSLPDVVPKAETGSALTTVQQFSRDVEGSLRGIAPVTVPITLEAQAQSILADLGSFFGQKKAAGGPITGGVPGHDSVPALLMPGEHVLTTREVAAMGGHGAVMEMRRGLARFARGGEVGGAASVSVTPVAHGVGLNTAVAGVVGAFAAVADAIGSKLSAAIDKAAVAAQAAAAAAQAAAGAVGGLGGGKGMTLGNGLYRPANGPITQGLHDQWTGYPALDIGVGVGTPIYAGAAGRVTTSADIYGNQVGGYASYGRYIKIAHTGGFSTLYAHLSQRGASVGDTVSGGTLIGLSGDTGNTFGAHLHFGAQGKSPYAWYDQGGVLNPGYTLAHNTTGHQETIVPAPPQYVNAALRSVAGGVDKALVAAVNALQREVAQLRTGTQKVHVDNPDVYDNRTAAIASGVADRQLAAMQRWGAV